MGDFEDLLKNFDKQVKSIKKRTCKRCGEPPVAGKLYCQKCIDEKEEDRVKRLEGKQATSQGGYKYQYDSNGKLRVASRVIMERHIGRPLRESEVVLYRDGDKNNLDISNLVIGWKAGMPLDFLTCKCCGARGNVIFDPPKENNEHTL